MIKTRLRYCVFDPDPNGNPRYYIRKPGRAKIRIREPFEGPDGNITPEFMKAYFDALASLDGAQPAPKVPREKTFYWLVDQYTRSAEFARYDVSTTQPDKRGVLNRFCATAGESPYASFRQEDVERSRDKRSSTPGAVYTTNWLPCMGSMAARKPAGSLPLRTSPAPAKADSPSRLPTNCDDFQPAPSLVK